MQLENAIQEAMAELDRYSEKPSGGQRRCLASPGKTRKIVKKGAGNTRIVGKAMPISSSGGSLRNRDVTVEQTPKRTTAKQHHVVRSTESPSAARPFKKQCR